MDIILCRFDYTTLFHYVDVFIINDTIISVCHEACVGIGYTLRGAQSSTEFKTWRYFYDIYYQLFSKENKYFMSLQTMSIFLKLFMLYLRKLSSSLHVVNCMILIKGSISTSNDSNKNSLLRKQ